jgi:hypothetical protein
VARNAAGANIAYATKRCVPAMRGNINSQSKLKMKRNDENIGNGRK